MRGEFLTSYTPYQPEVSQGTLQTIFEFQSLVCELTGMDVANAGMYDGATALAEACLMACAVTGRRRIAISDRVHPNWIAVVRSYAHGRGIAVDVQPHARVLSDGRVRMPRGAAAGLLRARVDGRGHVGECRAHSRSAVRGGGRSGEPGAVPAAVGVRRGHRRGRGAVAGRAAVIRRAVRRAVRLPRAVHPPDARAHRRRDNGRGRHAAATCSRCRRASSTSDASGRRATSARASS